MQVAPSGQSSCKTLCASVNVSQAADVLHKSWDHPGDGASASHNEFFDPLMHGMDVKEVIRACLEHPKTFFLSQLSGHLPGKVFRAPAAPVWD